MISLDEEDGRQSIRILLIGSLPTAPNYTGRDGKDISFAMHIHESKIRT